MIIIIINILAVHFVHVVGQQLTVCPVGDEQLLFDGYDEQVGQQMMHYQKQLTQQQQQFAVL